MAQPVAHSYGKDAVSLYRTDGERLFACEVRMVLRGEAFEPSYTEGDNSMVVATDSMKNFVHRAALDYEGACLEDFLAEVANRFLERYTHVETLKVEGRERAFARREGVVFQRLHGDVAVAEVLAARDGARMERSGREGLHLVKLSGSAFAGFVRDEFTTLPEARDRPLLIHLDVHWHNSELGRRADGEAVRDAIIATFADFVSESIQHLVHEMGVRALERFPEIDSISFHGENRLWDTAEEQDGTAVFTDARPPFGIIELTLGR